MMLDSTVAIVCYSLTYAIEVSYAIVRYCNRLHGVSLAYNVITGRKYNIITGSNNGVT